MNKIYTRINWENYPSEATALNETNLNRMDFALDEVDNRVISLDTSKATKTEVATLVADVSFVESTGIITVTKKNGSVITIDTKMEKIAVNFDYNSDTQQIILTLVDGTKQYIDLSALITQYEFLDSDTIAFVVQSDGKIKAEVLDGSIKESKLQPNYLATIKVEVAKAEASATAAATSEANALASENAAKTSETNAKTSEINAKNSEENASTSADTASAKATEAGNSANAAATSATNASSSATTATNKATAAANSATSASKSADTATNKASEASTSATNSNTYATKSQSYAVGGTGTRTGEDTDNAKYYNEQAKQALSEMQKSQVTGVKGNNETTFRTGNVNLTPANLGALATNGDSKSNTVTFTSNDVADGSATSWTSVTKLESGISHATFFQRVSQMFKNIRYLYKVLGTADISSIGDGTLTGAISNLNSNLVPKYANVKPNRSELGTIYTLSLIKVGRIVTANTTFIPSTDISYSSDQAPLFILPEGYRPYASHSANAPNVSGLSPLVLTIKKNGDILMQNISGPIKSGRYTTFQACWICA